ncbi:MAG: transcriptional regulator [Methanomicrobiales archaeon]|nr:transcriptional regulator [Methanomicrobiales archaeon]
MMQEQLLHGVVGVMRSAGFQVSERCSVRPRSFDLIAADGALVVIKVVSHIDSVTEEIAWDMDVISRYLGGYPLIVGEKARDSLLERGAVYIRYGIFAISLETLHDYFVEKIPPLVYASPGGLYVNIDGDLLRKLRENYQLSLGDLAHILGVSRRTISKYESGMGTTLDVAARIEELFDTAIAVAIDILKSRPPHVPSPEPPAVHLPPDIERMGMEPHGMRRAPFDALVIFKTHRIITGYGSVEKAERHAPFIGNISQVARTHALCITTDETRKRWIGSTLIIGERKLRGLEDGSELIELIQN